MVLKARPLAVAAAPAKACSCIAASKPLIEPQTADAPKTPVIEKKSWLNAALDLTDTYQAKNPAMFVPVTLPPLAAALLIRAATKPEGASQSGAKWGMWAVSAMGVGGVAFHAYGVARMMGGWANWRQNLIDGPPLPAPRGPAGRVPFRVSWPGRMPV